MSSEVCILDDGRRVRFSIKKRQRDPFYLVNFRGPDGQWRELSTKEGNKKRATDAALVLIREAFTPVVEPPKNPSWEEALDTMLRQMKADNLRSSTIDQYKFVVNGLRSAFPDTHGPAAITPAMASRYKVIRTEAGVSVRTVQGNLDNLNIVFNKWWIKECKILTGNPFADVSMPKADRPTPRKLTDEEVAAFLGWLQKRWRDWRLPNLFLEVKGLVGCRITELASAVTSDLRDGRIHFPANLTKGRKERAVKLPPAIFEELRAIAGPHFVFEAHSAQLRRFYVQRGWTRQAKMVEEFSPKRLRLWLEREKRLYLKKNPGVKKFKLHNLRGAAMSKAKEAGIHFEDAATAFGCNPDTMRKHYLAMDEVAVTDRVMEAIQGKRNGTEPTQPDPPQKQESLAPKDEDGAGQTPST